MNLLKKLFKQTKSSNAKLKDSIYQKYQIHLLEKGLSTIDDLEEIVKPLLKDATRIVAEKPSRPPENSQLDSHFGGQPYFEQGEKWPISKSGSYLNFIFQVFNDGNNSLPDDIKLVQFYYDWESLAWSTECDGWLVKVYKEIKKDSVQLVKKPSELENPKFCKIKFENIKTLPDWEGISSYNHDALKLSCLLDEEKPWGSYDLIVKKLIDKQDYRSQLGGYPMWVQGESTPINNNGDKMKLLFQIDSEDNAGIMFGDCGLVYVFYDNKTMEFKFEMQCC